MPLRDRSGSPESAKRRARLVVPGSGLVKAQAEAEGLDQIFTAAGMEWRAPAALCASL